MAELGPWPRDRAVAVAVSGGADSLCLARLCAAWGRPLGLIVDHGLRAGSAAEAAQAADRLAAMGLASEVLSLRMAGGPGVSARARVARYAALGAAMREKGLSDLLLGHHAADQAETVLMRRLAASGPDGLAGMAPVVEASSHRVVRPLLDASPERLRARLREEGIGWAEDPGNRDARHLRARLRVKLAADADESEGLLAQGRQAATARVVRGREVASTLARRLEIHPEGFALLRPGPLGAAALSAVVQMLTGASYPASTFGVSRLAGDLRPCTLGGVRLLPAGRLGPGLLLVRERAAMQGEVAAVPGAVWDRRFHLADWVCPPKGTTLGPLGSEAAMLRGQSALPDVVLHTLPAFRLDGVLLAVPHIDFFRGWTLPSGGMSLRPAVPACRFAFQA